MAKLDIGDAVLTFYGSTNDLDIALAGIPGKTKAATDQAGASIDNFAQSMVNTGQAGTSLADAIKLIPAPVQQTDTAVQNMAFSLRNIAPATDEATEATGRSMNAYQKARGEIMLLGEATGIHLPRSIATMIAGIPAIQGVLQGAFAATAVVFLIEALVKGIEKIEAWREQGEKIAQAWRQYDQTIFESSTHMQKEIDKQEEKLIEMTQGPVAALEFALKHLQSTSFETFGDISKAVDAAMKAMNQNAGFGNVFGDAAKDLDKFKDKLQEVMRLAAQAHPEDMFAPYSAAIASVQQKERDLTALIKQRTAASGADASAAIDGLHAERKAINDMLPLLQQGIQLEKDRAKTVDEELAEKKAEQLAKDVKRGLDQQIASIEAWKASVHQAYLQGTSSVSDWKVAELQATQATALAHEDYLQKLVTIYQRAGMTLKAQETAQELLTLRTKDAAKASDELAVAEQKRHDVGQKLLEQYRQMVDSGIDKSWQANVKAIGELEAAEKKLAESESVLAKARSSDSIGYKEQEEAIKRLAQLQLITEAQKSKQLQMLYARESEQAVNALNNQLREEQAAVQRAQANLQAAEGNPFFTDAQVKDLRAKLALAQAAMNQTNAAIAKTQDDFRKKELADDTSYYAQTLELAIVYGQKEQAQALQNIHSTLLLAQAKLQEAKAHGHNTLAIEAEIRSLQKEQQGQARLIQSTLQTGQAIENLKDVANQAYTSMAEAFATAADAMISKQKSFGQAMVAAVLDMLAEIAKHYAKIYIAKGIGNLADLNWSAAALDFAAAAAFETVAGVLTGAASNIGQSKPSGASSSGATISSDGGTSSGGASTSGVNVPKLADGGLVMSPTLAMVGDAPGGEAIIPLHDAAALSRLATAIAAKMPQQAGGGGGPLQIHLQSDIPLTVRKITQKVNKGQARLLSSNSIRVTRRSV